MVEDVMIMQIQNIKAIFQFVNYEWQKKTQILMASFWNAFSDIIDIIRKF